MSYNDVDLRPSPRFHLSLIHFGHILGKENHGISKFILCYITHFLLSSWRRTPVVFQFD